MSNPSHRPHSPAPQTEEHLHLADRFIAHNYYPLPVVVAQAEGAWVTDVDGRRYLDCLAGYSALNFGHRHPALLQAARDQLDRLTLTSRAFHNDQLGPFCRDLAALADMEMVLPMNTGAEAVETSIKVARKWGYDLKGIRANHANIVVAANNFHGRTTTIVSFSTDPLAREGFGPFTPGFRVVPYSDADALRDAIDGETVAVLIEPVQGEAGVIVPPDGYLSAVREICTELDVLFIADEIQSGLGRTGTTFACDIEGVVPDVYVLGKALGGGIVPVSAVVSSHEILGVLHPGNHGSTFGGNPLAAAVGHAVVKMLETGEMQERARELAGPFEAGLRKLVGQGVVEVRTRGLWAGIDVEPSLMSGRELCERMLAKGVLVKDTHGSSIRLAPPLVADHEDLEWMTEQLGKVLTDR
ncbi:MAG TPA: ornithine--oxo-acid transaminase [Nocardioidaceae bacterium]